ncbi:MAG: glutamyl-tRNA reductase [Bacillota bacterium]|nr:glutamyl-tRNA reductase [Bacillota bacterium]
MNILVIGVNYRQTPVEIREKLNFSIDEQRNAVVEISKLKGVNECALLSTCNRTEVYIYTSFAHFDSSIIENKLCELKGLDIYYLKKYFNVFSSLKAVKHLFMVAGGLDSMVLGEDQILGQVKDAHEIALENGTSESVLNTLFRDAVTAAKKVKTFTEISKNSVSIGSNAVKLVERIFSGEMNKKRALVIGAGKIGSIAFKNLMSDELKKVYITYRNHKKIEDNYEMYDNVEMLDYNMRYSVIDDCDIIISATTSPHYTITRDLLEKSVVNNKKRIFIDLAVPRDIDLAIKEIPWVGYYNIDDLQLEVDKNLDKRLLEVSKAEEIIDQYIIEYENWYEFRNVLPIVKDVQKYTDEIVTKKINYALTKLKSSSEEDKELIRNSMSGIANEILNKLLYSVKENDCKEDIKAYFRCLREVMKE